MIDGMDDDLFFPFDDNSLPGIGFYSLRTLKDYIHILDFPVYRYFLIT